MTAPPDAGGLGFHYKWDMGWMNDTMRYCHLDPLFRSHPESHRLVTFRGIYANSERFILALSHDEVVHGKRSLLGKQWGDSRRQFAGLRTLFGYMWSVPGKKLLFMGGEFGQWTEWNHDAELDWVLLEYPPHQEVLSWVRTLNTTSPHRTGSAQGRPRTRGLPVGRGGRLRPGGRSPISEWHPTPGPVLVLLNFTPVPWENYRVGVPQAGAWEVLASSDDPVYGGTGLGRDRGRRSRARPPARLRPVTQLDLATAFGSIHGSRHNREDS